MAEQYKHQSRNLYINNHKPQYCYNLNWFHTTHGQNWKLVNRPIKRLRNHCFSALYRQFLFNSLDNFRHTSSFFKNIPVIILYKNKMNLKAVRRVFYIIETNAWSCWHQSMLFLILWFASTHKLSFIQPVNN